MSSGIRTPITAEQFAALPSRHFDWMTTDQRLRLFAFLVQSEYESRQFVCGVDNREPPDGLYVVVSGEVRVTYRPNNGRTRPIEVRGPGEVFGFDPMARDREPFRARASCKTRLLFLPRSAARQIAATMPDIGLLLRRVMLQLRHGAAFLSAIQLTPLFRNATMHTAELLLGEAEERVLADGPYIRAGEAPRGLSFVVSGELERSLPSPEGGRFVDVRGAGGVIGEAAIFEACFTGPAAARVLNVSRPESGGGVPASEPLDVDVREEAVVVEIPAEVCIRVLRRFRFLHDTRIDAQRARDCEMVLFCHEGAAPLGAIIELLARTAAREHQDRIAVVYLEELAPGEPPQPPIVVQLENGVTRVTMKGNQSLTQADRDGLITAAFDAYDYIFINGQGLPRDALVKLAATTGFRRVCNLTRDTFSPLPDGVPGVDSILYATFVRDSRPASEGPAYRPGTVRLGCDPRAFNGATLEGLDVDTLADLKRWVRALTRRRVGVALGGGGAWGFAHVPFLQELLKRGIPIDVVTGASFGSVAGAYFAAFAGNSAGGWGSAGLAKLVGDRGKLSDVTAKAMFRSGFLRDAIDAATGAQRLESLVVPFFPMGSNLDDGTQWAIYRGTLGEGVVGSSAFPMIYPAAEIGGTRYLDGCMISNVPDEVLRAEGADLLIASNVCADPCATDSVKVEDFGRLVRLAGKVLPVQRVLDAWRGVQMLLHEMSVYNASRSEFLFQPDPVPWFFWDMEEGYRIAMESLPQAREVADQIEVRWRRMSRQRYDEPPRMTEIGPFGMRPPGDEGPPA